MTSPDQGSPFAKNGAPLRRPPHLLRRPGHLQRQGLTIFWGRASTTPASINGFYTGVTNSAYFDWLTEYNTPTQTIGRGTLRRHVQLHRPRPRAPSTTARSRPQSRTSSAAASVPAPDANTSTRSTSRPASPSPRAGRASCSYFCAYHGTIARHRQGHGPYVYYGVIPDQGGACAGGCGNDPSPFNNTTSVSSHEMIEAITDAAVGLATGNASPLAWYDQTNGEIGDICNAQQGTIVGGDGKTYVVQLAAIRVHGVPNYFGEQRFGRDAGNLERARAMFAGRRMSRDQRGLLLSAARAELFNGVLAARVECGNWDRGLDGEVWMLDGSHSIFGPEPFSEELGARLVKGDIHPTGPLWGNGPLRSTGSVAELECKTAASAADLTGGLKAAGLSQERRSLRLMPGEFVAEWLEDMQLKLIFHLNSGSYATAIIREICDWSADVTTPADQTARIAQ